MPAGLGAYVAVRWLTRWVHAHTLRPVRLVCLLAGAGWLALFAVR